MVDLVLEEVAEAIQADEEDLQLQGREQGIVILSLPHARQQANLSHRSELGGHGIRSHEAAPVASGVLRRSPSSGHKEDGRDGRVAE